MAEEEAVEVRYTQKEGSDEKNKILRRSEINKESRASVLRK
jgi:hypothetical protein